MSLEIATITTIHYLLHGVFASSLRSLISPWALSKGAHYPRSPARCPRPVAPPPLPRRNSDPISTNTTTPQKKFRRYSDVRNPKPDIDLRQELLDLDLNNREVDQWLGNKFEEDDEDVQSVDIDDEDDFRFNHDIPLQRSISLDRGIEIFNYLQTLSSDESDSDSTSFWAMHSEERQNRLIEMHRSFEDVPASIFKVKSRRASLAVHNETYGQSLALFVLKESYKGMDEANDGNKVPQMKKLQKTFSFKTFDEIRESCKSSFEDLQEIGYDDEPKVEIRTSIQRNYMSSKENLSCASLSPAINNAHKTFTFPTYDDARYSDKSSAENLDHIGDSGKHRIQIHRRYNKRAVWNNGSLSPPIKKLSKFLSKYYDDFKESDNSSVEDLGEMPNSFKSRMDTGVPILKTISFGDKKVYSEDKKTETKDLRHRRVGVVANPPLQNLIKAEEVISRKQDLRKEILIKQNLLHAKSCEELFIRKKGKIPLSGSAQNLIEPTPSTSGVTKIGRVQSGSNISNMRKLKRTFSTRSFTETKERGLPHIVIPGTAPKKIVDIDQNVTPLNASNVVEISRNCDCRICSEDVVHDKKSFLLRNLKSLFTKIVSCREYGRKLTYWDDNNLDENEMYNCIMHILQMMFGIWLRHLDHN